MNKPEKFALIRDTGVIAIMRAQSPEQLLTAAATEDYTVTLCEMSSGIKGADLSGNCR
jgi:hypothetical protein